MSKPILCILFLLTLPACNSIRTVKQHHAQTQNFAEDLPEVSPKKWTPAGNNYYIDQINQRKLSANQPPLLEDEVARKQSLNTMPAPSPSAFRGRGSNVDNKIIDSYSYSSPASQPVKIENLTPEQFLYEQEHLEKK
jgi:hypothetical protein